MGKIWVENGNTSRYDFRTFSASGRIEETATPQRQDKGTNGDDTPAHAEGPKEGTRADGNDPFIERLARLNATLSRTELLVCSMIRESLPSKEIAQQLSISKFTVDTHRKSIRRKLGLDEKESLYSILIRL